MPSGDVPPAGRGQAQSGQRSRSSTATWPRTEVSTNAPSSKSGGERISAWRRFTQKFKKEGDE
ncbi:hypothetical protein RRF57_009504 [Xylaria bambusicola]|uniref:Uncharacterized protein n=1 Tax=Xylaria bambusicola TaxID=326684 RepID=A0AAN7UJR2_9PEZI